MKMSVDKDTMLKMAQAAQLRVKPEDVDSMVGSINDLLSICSLVGELDCSDTPDFVWKMNKLPSRRSDEAEDWADRERFKSEAPTIEGDFFRVPRISSEG